MIRCLGAYAGYLFADNLSVLVRAPIMKSFPFIVDYLEKEGTKVCDKIAEYAKRWKQPINVQKAAGQIFYTQIKRPEINITYIWKDKN